MPLNLSHLKKLDWILISSFDRWGIKEPDDIFVFRSRLRDYGVQLYSCIDELNITGIDLISLAKEKQGEDQDKVFIPGRKNPILLGRHSGPLHLLMRLRDEAHRFAITYHRKLRGKLRGKHAERL